MRSSRTPSGEGIPSASDAVSVKENDWPTGLRLRASASSAPNDNSDLVAPVILEDQPLLRDGAREDLLMVKGQLAARGRSHRNGIQAVGQHLEHIGQVKPGVHQRSRSDGRPRGFHRKFFRRRLAPTTTSVGMQAGRTRRSRRGSGWSDHVCNLRAQAPQVALEPRSRKAPTPPALRQATRHGSISRRCLRGPA